MHFKRFVSCSFITGDAFLTLWGGTEDQESFKVRSLKRGVPYVIAHGEKVYLTEKEIEQVKYCLSEVSKHKDLAKGVI